MRLIWLLLCLRLLAFLTFLATLALISISLVLPSSPFWLPSSRKVLMLMRHFNHWLLLSVHHWLLLSVHWKENGYQIGLRSDCTHQRLLHHCT